MKFIDLYYLTNIDTAINVVRGGLIIKEIKRGKRSEEIPLEICRSDVKCITSSNYRTIEVYIK